MPRLILLCGLPGAGKTTLARQIESDLSALRLCPDEWLEGLGASLFDEYLRARVETLQWELAQRVLALGSSVVLENGFWGRSERDAIRSAARALGTRVELRFLDAPAEELWRRIELRNQEDRWRAHPIRLEQLEEWARLLEAPDAAELALFDGPE